MGRNNHGSFSFRNKTNLQLFKKKLKIKSIKETFSKKKETEKDEQLCRKEENAWKRFWWRWLSFIRGHRSGREVQDCDIEVHPGTITRGSKNLEMNGTSMDVIEIPIEPGQKISEILIKPTKTGIKAMIAQCRKSTHSFPQTPTEGHRTSDDEGSSWVARVLSQNGRRLSDCSAEADKKRLNSKWTTFKSGSGLSSTNETLPTSALFIRENMDDIVESTAFFEPNLPNDYPESRISDESSQKSTKINKRRISYRILGEKNDEIQSTFKTVSEPTWFERKNIFRRRRLQEDINDLLEQFLFLESEDSVGLTSPMRSRPTADKKAVQYKTDSCLGRRKHSIKEVCREVSPEILVNIKPFKEYLSDDHLWNGVPLEGDHPNRRKSSRRSLNGQVRTSRKQRSAREKMEMSEECIYPVLNGISISKKNHTAIVLENNLRFKDEVQAISAMEREIMQACFEECEEHTSLSLIEPPLCTLRGICKTYGVFEEGRNSGTGTERESKKESLDELLDTLDDSDHDVVFQRNMSQFRKKINVVPRLDFRKSVGGVVDGRKKEHKKTKKPQSYLKFVNPIVECVAEELEEEVSWDQQKRRSGALSMRSPEEWEGGRRLNRTLVTNVMLLSERNLVRRALASRVEEVMVSVVATWREMWNLMESWRCTLVQRERPGWEGAGLVRMQGALGEMSIHQENVTAVSRILGMQSEDMSLVRTSDVAVLGEAIPESLSFISSTSDCAYIIGTSSFSNYHHISICESKKLTPTENPLRINADKSEKRSKEVMCPYGTEIDTNVKEGFVLMSSEPAFSPACELVQILSNMTFNYVMNIGGNERGCFSWSTSGESHSKSFCPENIAEANSIRTCITSVVSSAGSSTVCSADNGAVSNAIPTKVSETISNSGKPPDPQVDGFQILYNNNRESLNDDDEDVTKVESVKSLDSEKQNRIFTVEDSEDVYQTERNKGEETHWDGDAEKKVNRFLNTKSSSSPKENIIQSEFGPQEHRMRRSLNFSKEFEKELQNGKKRRLSVDKGMDIRRTGSASLESHCPKISVQKKSSFGRDNKFTSLIFANELKPKLVSEKQKLPLSSDNGGVNLRKEVVAAFNSIKEMNAGKGETKGGNKRMSLVIMFCRK